MRGRGDGLESGVKKSPPQNLASRALIDENSANEHILPWAGYEQGRACPLPMLATP